MKVDAIKDFTVTYENGAFVRFHPDATSVVPDDAKRVGAAFVASVTTPELSDADYKSAAQYANKRMGLPWNDNDSNRARHVMAESWVTDKWTEFVREYFASRTSPAPVSEENIITLLREADAAATLFVGGRFLVKDLAAVLRHLRRAHNAAVLDADDAGEVLGRVKGETLANAARRAMTAHRAQVSELRADLEEMRRQRDARAEAAQAHARDATGARNHLCAILNFMWPMGTTAPAPVRAAREYLAGNAPAVPMDGNTPHAKTYAPADIPEAVFKAAADAANKVTRNEPDSNDIRRAQEAWQNKYKGLWFNVVGGFVRGYLYALGNGPA